MQGHGGVYFKATNSTSESYSLDILDQSLAELIRHRNIWLAGYQFTVTCEAEDTIS
jgi:hypothetical protein